jgi:hypothetical protein
MQKQKFALLLVLAMSVEEAVTQEGCTNDNDCHPLDNVPQCCITVDCTSNTYSICLPTYYDGYNYSYDGYSCYLYCTSFSTMVSATFGIVVANMLFNMM